MEGISPDRLSVAPMIKWTDRHWRFMMRSISRRSLLYTEMIVDNAMIRNVDKLDNFLGHSPLEEPLAVQLGGCNAAELAQAAALCEQYGGFCEINLNCGCPSDRAKKTGFGAELMLHPPLVHEILHQMQRQATTSSITVKCRIGVTGRESWEELVEFVHAVSSSGVRKMIIHARNCVLKGLSPAQNRSIPPLRPEIVHRLVAEFPEMRFILNGGITDFDTAKRHLGLTPDHSDLFGCDVLLPPVQGVMIGREAYNHPFSFSTADSLFFGVEEDNLPTRKDVLTHYLDYADRAQRLQWADSRSSDLVKPLHNLFHHCQCNGRYKQFLDSELRRHSKAIDKDKVPLSEVIWDIVRETVPGEVLAMRGMPPPSHGNRHVHNVDGGIFDESVD